VTVITVVTCWWGDAPDILSFAGFSIALVIWLAIFFPPGTGIARCANQLSYTPMTSSQRTIDRILSLLGSPRAEPCRILKKTL
jgi:hypothetical protein